MTTPSDVNNLELSVTNLGPIARANIDLRPMTVFVGPSNTGKSYLAILIYALHGFFGGRAIRPRRRRSIFGIGPRSRGRISHSELKMLTDWVSGRLSKGRRKDSESATVLPAPVANLVRRWLEGIGDYAELLDTWIARCYGVDDSSSLVRNGAGGGSRIVVKQPALDADESPTQVGYSLSIGRGKFELGSHIPDSVPLRFLENEEWRQSTTDLLQFMYTDVDDGPHIARTLLSYFAEAIGPDFVSPLDRQAYYLPADRTGVMHAHRVIVRSMISQAPRAGLQRDALLPQLSGVLADFLEELIGLDDQRRSISRRPGEALAKKIEEDILHGKIHMERLLVGYPEFLYRPDQWKKDLGLMNTSSMVSELAPVVLYLRHVVRPGDVLIIEEPESHLHPAMQVAFIRQLAAVVQSGIRIMITTHSEWVLDELANLVRLSDAPKSKREGIGGGDYALDRDQVGVWLFEPKKRPRGSVVKEIPFDEDFGGYRSGFDEVAIGTYNDYAEISNRIEEAKA